VTAGDAEFRDDAVDRCTLRLVGGDRSAYELLFRRRVAFVEAESLRILGRRHDLAADAAQDAWLRVARAPRRCATSASLDAWLRRIVRSAAIDLLRSELARRCRERRVARMREEAADYLKDFELLEQIRHDASRLHADDRSLLELVARTDATIASIAEWLGIGRAAADSRLRRAAERARALRMNP
jgi:RNA polymerase sigma factor (sigma-70 family)